MILNRLSQRDDKQLIPEIPTNVKKSMEQEQSQKNRINANYLAQRKMQKVYESINQTLAACSDEWIQTRYFQFLKMNNVTIQSDIFERMDLDRRIIESLRKLQYMDNLTEEEFYEKKMKLMRKLTEKATKFLYDREQITDNVDQETMRKEKLQEGQEKKPKRKLFDEDMDCTGRRKRSSTNLFKRISSQNLRKSSTNVLSQDNKHKRSNASILEDDSMADTTSNTTKNRLKVIASQDSKRKMKDQKQKQNLNDINELNELTKRTGLDTSQKKSPVKKLNNKLSFNFNKMNSTQDVKKLNSMTESEMGDFTRATKKVSQFSVTQID